MKNASQSKDNTDNAPTDKTEQLLVWIKVSAFKWSFCKKFKQKILFCGSVMCRDRSQIYCLSYTFKCKMGCFYKLNIYIPFDAGNTQISLNKWTHTVFHYNSKTKACKTTPFSTSQASYFSVFKLACDCWSRQIWCDASFCLVFWNYEEGGKETTWGWVNYDRLFLVNYWFKMCIWCWKFQRFGCLTYQKTEVLNILENEMHTSPLLYF